MVRNAPPLKAVMHELADFVGDAPVLGHNVRFDLSFLQPHNILLQNDVLDTYELASVLMPTASRYNLGALGQCMGVLLPATHRALDDARVTHAVYIQLYEAGLEPAHRAGRGICPLERDLRLGRALGFQPDPAYAHAPAGRHPAAVSKRPPASRGRDSFLPPLVPVEPPKSLDEDEVAALLEYGGPFSRYFEQYEYRTQQVKCCARLPSAFSNGHHLLVEAGTGTGKSFAYLVPAAMWAMQNNTRVVISTNTINLQDQLIKKDIPDLRKALDLDLRAAVLKGRANYLCPRRLEVMRQRGPDNVDEMRVLAKILVWLQSADSGDRGEINLNGPAEREIWMRLSAEDEGCKSETCQVRTEGGCPFYRARQAAQSAHLLVVNHALLLSDVATGNRVLPEYNYLIIDEGHHMEAATTNALSFRVTQGDILRLLRESGWPCQRHPRLPAHPARRPAATRSDLPPSTRLSHRATDLLFRLEHCFREFFNAVEDFLAEQREGRPVSSYGQQERIVEATRTLPVWTNVEIAWDEVARNHRAAAQPAQRSIQIRRRAGPASSGR